MRADLLLDMRRRLRETVMTNVTVNGKTFTYEDVCFNVPGAYSLPCTRYSVLDCFREGDYDLLPRHTQSWRKLIHSSQIKPNVASAAAQMLPSQTLIYIGLAMSPFCKNSCNQSKIPSAGGFPPWNLLPNKKWPESPACHVCLDGVYGMLPDTGSTSKQNTKYLVIASRLTVLARDVGVFLSERF